MSASPLIVGLAGTELSAAERRFLERVRPVGVIVFARNIASGPQLRALVDSAREAGGSALALVDQEGGRVQRVRPPLAPAHPPARAIGRASQRDPRAAERLAFLSGRLIAGEIAPFGLDTPCLPVADVPVEGAHDVIGDRAYADDPQRVAALAGRVAEGVLAAGSLPVVKHVPGHGRATADSHVSLPTVDASAEDLSRDVLPFRALNHLPLAMTAHVRFLAIDGRPATISPVVIGEVIRGAIGFDGLLMSDDISMGALAEAHGASEIGARAAQALEAGCDVVLHCNGEMSEMEAIAANLPPLADAGRRRLDAALAARRHSDGADLAALRHEFEALLTDTSAQALDEDTSAEALG